MAVVPDLSEEERYLLALLLDESGIDLAEFMFVDETRDDGIFRAYDYQIPWWREDDKRQVDQSARAVGKSIGIQLRSFAFPFTSPGHEMLLTAPELIHLDPVTKYVEDRIRAARLSREMLRRSGTSDGIVRRPFEATFKNGARIRGRIPQKDGRGIKGQHPKKLEMDESQDYPEDGYIELTETLKYGDPNATWRAHGVTNGARDFFWKITQADSGWKVNRITAMHRNDWSAEEREAKAKMYGGRHSPDYRRNILGAHGDIQNSLFVLTRLMNCADQNPESTYNRDEYQHIRINHERVEEVGGNILSLLDFHTGHKAYQRAWAGMDVGMTDSPSEILVFGEADKTHSGGSRKRDAILPDRRFKLLTRLHLERISSSDQRMVMGAVAAHYNLQGFGMDSTGLGKPIYSEILSSDDTRLKRVIRGYDFGSKILIGYEPIPEDEADPKLEDYEIWANVLEWASDMLRLMVDSRELILPWDIELLREWQGQTYKIQRSNTNPYGRKVFNRGSFHCLDAARCFAVAYFREAIDVMAPVLAEQEPVLDMWAGV